VSNKLKEWRERSDFTLAEAALLITENYPDDFANKNDLLNVNPPQGFMAIYGQLRSDAVRVRHENIQSQEDSDCYYTDYNLNTDNPEGVKKITEEDGFNVHVDKSELVEYLLMKKINTRFFSDETLNKFESSEDLVNKNHHNISNQLVLINQASFKFWANADRNDRDTHPKNADIAAWLVEREFSESLAQKAASIIRPEWAPSGRKSEK
jgi:hypothetical protein